ncbi:hypothetical protein RF11_10553 [Thelohanellus kitauei]|uniref:Uncharacterized protein n=1 Tax=Thelohanellus kitauei TaxID=669202 RepID=A0A0C2M728_THEKT|nr:hypothetical protein RF11_10553 [Thelohanellus kitauei]
MMSRSEISKYSNGHPSQGGALSELLKDRTWNARMVLTTIIDYVVVRCPDAVNYTIYCINELINGKIDHSTFVERVIRYLKLPFDENKVLVILNNELDNLRNDICQLQMFCQWSIQAGLQGPFKQNGSDNDNSSICSLKHSQNNHE